MTHPSVNALRAMALGLGLMLAVAPVTRAASDPLVPADAELIVHVNVRDVLDSGFVKKYAADHVQNLLRNNLEASLILQQLNFDPMKDLQSLTLAIKEIKVEMPAGAAPRPGAGGAPPASAGEILLILRGQFDLDKIHATLAEAAKGAPNKLNSTKYGEYKVYEGRNDENKPLFFTFLNKNTILAGDKKATVTSAIDRSSGRSIGNVNKALAGIMEKADTRQPVWAVMPIPQSVRERLKNVQQPQAAALGQLEGLSAAATAKDDITAEISLHAADANSAGQLRMQIDQMKFLLAALAMQDKDVGPTIAEVVTNMKSEVRDKSVVVKLTVTSAMVEKAIKRANSNKDK